MKKYTRFALLLLGLAGLGVSLIVFRPQAEEVGGEEPPAVSESDLHLYINVYTAMQSDHDLTIDNAIKTYHISLDDFRQLERKVQSQPRLVERVREALLEHAKSHSVFAQAAATAVPLASPTAAKPKAKKK